MHRQFLLISVLLPGLLVGQTSPSVPGGHRWIVEQFFFATAWPTKGQYYSGEMATHYAKFRSMGELGAPARRGSVRSIQGSSSQAVYTVQVGRAERVEDWYAYVVKGDSGWRLSAVRTLALPPICFMAMDSLSATKPLTDSLAGVLENMRLTASSDSALKQFFLARRTDLQRIADGFSRETAGSISAAPDGLKAPTGSLRSLAQQLPALHLRGAWRDSEFAECVFVEVGGMIDNEVGFMRCISDSFGTSNHPGALHSRRVDITWLVSLQDDLRFVAVAA